MDLLKLLKDTQKLYQDALEDELARKMYHAYGGHTNWKNFQGNPMPEWDALPANIQGAWRTAAREAVNCLLDLLKLPRLS